MLQEEELPISDAVEAPEEILNIAYHMQIILLRALNCCENITEVAYKMKVCERNVYLWKKLFGIIYCKEQKKYKPKDENNFPSIISFNRLKDRSHLKCN